MERNAIREILLTLLRAEPITGITLEQWQSVMMLAEQHQVAPLLYRRIKSLGLDVPGPIWQSLRETYLINSNRNLFIYRKLAPVLEAFQQANTLVIPLKGVYLAEHVYGNVAVRPMNDIDLLVHKSDLAQVETILEGLNYRRTHQVTDTLKEAHHFGYKHVEHGIFIEVHWNLVNDDFGVHVDIDALMDRSRAALTAKVPVREMLPEDQVLHLCIHTAMHRFEIGVRAMCDLAETVRHYQTTIDWECLRQRARQWGVEHCAYLNLRLAKELLNAPVSENWLNTLQPDDFDPGYLALAQEYLFAYIEETSYALPQMSQFVRIWMTRNLVRRMVMFWQGVFLPPKVLAMRYSTSPNSWRILLYYPIRIRDLWRKHSRVSWDLTRGNQQMLSWAQQQDQINKLQEWLLSA